MDAEISKLLEENKSDIIKLAEIAVNALAEIESLRQQLAKPVDEVINAARKTLTENPHLADGDNCTLFELREALAAYDAKATPDNLKDE